MTNDIKREHHRAADVRPSDMANLLHNFAKLQSEKNIIPPIFDYDQSTRTMRIVDSTFYFYLRNIDRRKIFKNLINPLETDIDSEDKSKNIEIKKNYGEALNGSVKFFNISKGYGFIETEKDKNIFVHFTSIVGDGFKTLDEGEKVQFKLITTKKGLQAIEVERSMIKEMRKPSRG